jgi:hypothetical protein
MMVASLLADHASLATIHAALPVLADARVRLVTRVLLVTKALLATRVPTVAVASQVARVALVTRVPTDILVRPALTVCH